MYFQKYYEETGSSDQSKACMSTLTQFCGKW